MYMLQMSQDKFHSRAFKSYYVSKRQVVKAYQSKAGRLYAIDSRVSLIIAIICVGDSNSFCSVQLNEGANLMLLEFKKEVGLHLGKQAKKNVQELI